MPDTPTPKRPHLSVWPSYVPHRLDLPCTSIFENLAISARRHPDKPAFICYESPITYAALHRDAVRLAGFLQQRCGVGKGDRVILYAQNSIQFVIAYYAILRADAVVVPLNPMNLTEELRRYANDCTPKAAIVAQELWPRVEPLAADGTLGHVVVAAYRDYLGSPTSIQVPDAFKAQRQEIGGE